MIRGFDLFGGSLPPIKMPELRTKFRRFLKNWRRPTLAESIKPLPSARLCLTAEFGMGSGRTTALWPPRNVTGDTWQVTRKPPNATNPKMEKNKRREVTCHVSHVTSAVL